MIIPQLGDLVYRLKWLIDCWGMVWWADRSRAASSEYEASRIKSIAGAMA